MRFDLFVKVLKWIDREVLGACFLKIGPADHLLGIMTMTVGGFDFGK